MVKSYDIQIKSTMIVGNTPATVCKFSDVLSVLSYKVVFLRVCLQLVFNYIEQFRFVFVF
jgi:hypothetical protein